MQTRTLLTRSPTALLAHLTHLSTSYTDHTLLFTLSSNIAPLHLSNLVTRLTTFSLTTLGCLSAPLPGPPHIACSLALFPPSSAVPFRSTLPGRAAPQVGRWHAFRNKDKDDEALTPPEGDFSWAEVWDRNAGGTPLPPGLQGLNPQDVNEVLYLTDRAPEGLANSLAAFPHATRLGLIAASTPFVTGRPVTLFHNNHIYDSGAVGLALTHPPHATVQTEFTGVTPLSGIMRVTSCEGNMINTLNNDNPTQLLLDTIRKNGMDMDASGSFKDDETFLLATIRDHKPFQMYSITAGDPSRGNISLASQNAPAEGTEVMFFHRPKSAKIEVPATKRPDIASAMRFLTCTETSLDAVDDEMGEVQTLQDTFVAASENGFLLSRPQEKVWTCTVPGSVASLEWSV
ncbi:hypothetical protein FPV67DRAFT_749080 [Lyophyllum atratum]|nr:hypothetical protein FPV67DRAFT_749080 [Lyophyllum atratum]